MGMVAKTGKARPWMLDLFSGGGIGADGYVRAGWRVVCVDVDAKVLEWVPWESHCRDALEVLEDEAFLARFQAIHASPPCQGFTAARELAKAQGKGNGAKTLDLLTPTLARLREMDVPWVVENVPRSPLSSEPESVQVCGSSFGLRVQRHRLFLGSGPLKGSQCDHDVFDVDEVTGKPRPWGVYYAMGDSIPSGGRTCATLEHAMECMGVGRRVPWDVLKEGLPPAFTHHVGAQMLEQISG